MSKTQISIAYTEDQAFLHAIQTRKFYDVIEQEKKTQ